MIYIPDQWLKNKDNLDKVHQIMDSGFYSDINLTSRTSKVVEHLREIGETTIADKIEKGEIVLPS